MHAMDPQPEYKEVAKENPRMWIVMSRSITLKTYEEALQQAREYLAKDHTAEGYIMFEAKEIVARVTPSVYIKPFK